MNIISHIENPRKIDYTVDLLSNDLPNKIYEGSNYEAYKLQIKQRHVQTMMGEINFLIRDKSNPLKYIIVYCLMMEPDKISNVKFYINDTVEMQYKELIKIEPLIDLEAAELFVKDLFINYISKNYDIV